MNHPVTAKLFHTDRHDKAQSLQIHYVQLDSNAIISIPKFQEIQTIHSKAERRETQMPGTIITEQAISSESILFFIEIIFRSIHYTST